MKIQDKLVSRDRLQEIVRQWQDQGEEVVFTNGCFDILHLGHVAYMEEARGLGDRLVVGVNADSSVKLLKGESRPINDEHARATVLAALECVDLVTIFAEETPLELIGQVIPDILVKGGDYQENEVVGGDIVKSHGGRVVILPFVEGYSTTAIEQKILSLQTPGK